MQVIEFLEEAGCSQSAIIDAALALFIPWQRSKEEQYQEVSKRISAALLDPTVCSLVCAACFLTSSESKQSKQQHKAMGMEPDATDISGPYLGITIAEHLAGSYAYFEYTRYIKHSPGIIGELKSPYLTNVLAGLIAGVTSRLYSEGW